LVRKCTKNVFICFIGVNGKNLKLREGNIQFTDTLEDIAYQAVSFVNDKKISPPGIKPEILSIIHNERTKLNKNQKYIRGLFSGGTLCYESLNLLQEIVGPVHSNKPLEKSYTLADIYKSQEHTSLDMGADEFVLGRPHPMIDPSLRRQRIIAEAKDPQTALILLDIILGFCSHDDPAGILVPAIVQAKEIAAKNHGHLSFVASLIGTDHDPQNLIEQETKLKEAGVIVFPSNTQATRVAAAIVNQNI